VPSSTIADFLYASGGMRLSYFQPTAIRVDPRLLACNFAAFFMDAENLGVPRRLHLTLWCEVSARVDLWGAPHVLAAPNARLIADG
jgi:hypothetical protein